MRVPHIYKAQCVTVSTVSPLAMLCVLRKTNTHTHTVSPWLKWNDFQMEMTRQSCRPSVQSSQEVFLFTSDFSILTHRTCVSHYSQGRSVSLRMSLFPMLMIYLSAQKEPRCLNRALCIAARYVQTANLQIEGFCSPAVSLHSNSFFKGNTSVVIF